MCEECLPIVSMIEHNKTANNEGVRKFDHIYFLKLIFLYKKNSSKNIKELNNIGFNIKTYKNKVI